MTLLLLHSPGWKPADIADALAADRVECRILWPGDEFRPDDRPTAFLLAPADRAAFGGRLEQLAEGGAAIVALGAPGEADVPES
ncbi:MAG: hypothetical protein ACHQ2E_04935, partial [Gemmatimonadales bacterium]